MNDRQRKDRLIQTRVPQNLESTLKDEARKRRLSVSHLIRNVLEDTFNLVDNVVVEVDRVVSDAGEMAATLKRDAQRLAATARGETAHRADSSRPPTAEDETPIEPADEAEASTPELSELGSTDAESASAADAVSSEPPSPPAANPLANVYAFQELVLNRPAECARCEGLIGRGARAFLALSEEPGRPRTWVCADCVDSIGGHGNEPAQ